MTEFPLFDLASQFQTDVQAISADFKSGVLEASNDFLQNMPSSREAADLRVETATSPSPNRGVGMQRLEQAIVVASPLKHSKQDARAPTPPPAVSPMLSRSGGRQTETGEQLGRIEVRKMPSIDGKGLCVAAPKTPTPVGLIASASPRPGLLDRMHARGIFSSGSTGTPPNPTLMPAANVVAAEQRGRTLERGRSSGESGLENARISEEGRRPASLDKASRPIDTPSPCATRSGRSELPLSSLIASPSSQPKAKRQRENSMVALYKAMVEPQLQIEKCSSEASLLKGKVTSAKKFRRSSMLKKAAIVVPAPAIAKASTPPTTTQVSTVVPSSVVVPEIAVPSVVASPEKTDAAVPKTTPAKPTAKQKANKAPGASGSQRPAKKQRPPVPSFSSPPVPQPCQMLRLTPLSPKRDEENYEISDKDENSDEEMEPDRSHKHVPKWCLNYLQLLAAQSSTDPDSIFGSKVPHCDLEAIFSIETYKRFGRDRPQRRRGSSGEWKKDRLRPAEISEYKQKMGQSEPWRKTSKNATSSSH